MLHHFYNYEYQPNPKGVSQVVKDLNNIFYAMARLSDLKKVNYKRPKEKQINGWFDRECKAVWNTLKTASNKKHRDPSHPGLRETYESIQRQYKTILRRKKHNYISTKLNQLQDALQDNSLWELWNHMGTKDKENNIHIQNGNIWLQYFRNLYKDIPKEEVSQEQESIMAKLKTMEEKVKNVQNPVDTPITLQEVPERISSIRCRKAGGLDGILPEMLKYSPPEIQAAMVKLFNIVLSASYIPRTWNQGLITPIHKNGDRYDPANYTGICVSSNLGKLFNSILNKRILSFLTEHNVLSKSQAGFMLNDRTTDHIYTLHSLIQRHVHNTKNGKIYACFMDFKKAFDSV
ncbi:uncharacterized protein [Dendrobates tinctorius]|uniref:uncharacterized protein n=1 Tax=Dendrobates tinctorius TaxID=92724 RepID=UPI003CCA5959